MVELRIGGFAPVEFGPDFSPAVRGRQIAGDRDLPVTFEALDGAVAVRVVAIAQDDKSRPAWVGKAPPDAVADGARLRQPTDRRSRIARPFGQPALQVDDKKRQVARRGADHHLQQPPLHPLGRPGVSEREFGVADDRLEGKPGEQRQMAMGVLRLHQRGLGIIEAFRQQIALQFLQVRSRSHLLQGQHIGAEPMNHPPERPLFILGLRVIAMKAFLRHAVRRTVIFHIVSGQGKRFRAGRRKAAAGRHRQACPAADGRLPQR